MTQKSKFVATENKGCQLTFKNGWTISIQWGGGTYSSNRMGKPKDKLLFIESASAEIVIWDTNKNYFVFGATQTCLGWLTTNEVAEWIEKVKNFK